MISKNNQTPKALTLKLQPTAQPPLQGGKYTLDTTVVVAAQGKVNEQYKSQLSFTVDGPRFGLDPINIYDVHPVANSSGAYHDTLPHIIFTRKTIPWEFSFKDNKIDPTNANPWLALLLLTEEEVKENNIKMQTIEIKTLMGTNPDSSILNPAINIRKWETEEIKENIVTPKRTNVIDIPLALFQKIAPKPDTELPFLAHTRQVDMSNKENTDLNPHGWFACMVSNRLPAEGSDNYMFLVSLEGHETAFTNSDKSKKARLVVMSQWYFRSEGATFSDIAEKLGKNIQPLKMEIDANSVVNQNVANAIRLGYTPMNHQLRNGQKTLSWYRGPLVPVDIPTATQYIYKSADEALRFDKNTGIFDISYASAWQIGRLLALQSPTFFKSLTNWKTAYKREKPLNIAKRILKNKLGIEPDKLADTVNAAESDEILMDLLIEFWNDK